MCADVQTERVEGYDDIGYNFLISTDGIVYEGRGWGVVGAHAVGYNKVSCGEYIWVLVWTEFSALISSKSTSAGNDANFRCPLATVQHNRLKDSQITSFSKKGKCDLGHRCYF